MRSALSTEAGLIGVALALSGGTRLTADERALRRIASNVSDVAVADAARAIARGEDPLGDAFCRLRSAAQRRPRGATYTPQRIVDAMVRWGTERHPTRVVDPGAGSGRFVVAAGRSIADAELVAIEIDPVAALLTRAHLNAAQLAHRARVLVADYRTVKLGSGTGRTLFIGNPPYVRHHGIDANAKRWLAERASALGLRASGLAGTHVHFLLATAHHALAGDAGCFITAAEWLDVNYGSLARELLVGPLGISRLELIVPTLAAFADAQTTAVITCFEVGEEPPTVVVRRARSLAQIGEGGGKRVPRERVAQAPRWTALTRAARAAPAEFVELGELCRVHRGQVTGANRVWIAGPHCPGLPPEVLFPTVTRARELFASGDALRSVDALRRVIDLPADLDTLEHGARRAVERFLAAARDLGTDAGFIARHRRPWWRVGLREPAPILATYMARRPPAFVRNLAGARHINIAHGLYPRLPMTPGMLDRLARHLSGSTALDDGRTYAGGLTKFEPREMERLLVPPPERLAR